MENKIIAGKFILIKTKGSSGSLTTYLAEDPLTDSRVIVKVFSDDNPMALELIKAMNMLNDHECRGVVTALEGGMLEDEPGYYLVFPEVPGPVLEEFLLLNPTMHEEELARLAREVEETLKSMHDAGFFHLFLSPRNIFYSPGRPVYLKDPALNYQLHSFLLQELQGFDYSYFSPRFMDGGEGCPEEDVFSLGRILGEVIDKVEWIGSGENRQAWIERTATMMASIDPGVSGGADEPGNDPGLEAGGAEEAGPIKGAAGERPDSIKALRLELESQSSGRKKGQLREEATMAGRHRTGRRMFSLVLAAILLCVVLIAAFGMPDGRDSRPETRDGTDQASPGEPETGEMEGASEEGPVATMEALPETAILPEVADTVEAQGGSFSGDYSPDAGDVKTAAEVLETNEGAPAANRKPVASFTVSPSEGSSPLQVYLDAGSSYDPDGDIASYSWSCGGGGISIYRVFESSVIPARISITLTVTDNSGASSSATRTITLY